MAEAGYVFEIVASEAEESNLIQSGLAELVEDNAWSKAHWVSERHPDAIVIGADTLVAIDGEALGKPADLEEATRMIRRLSGRTHEVCTGVAFCCADIDHSVRFHVVTEVTFKTLDKAGSYGAQEHGDDVIQRIEGSWSNVVGLPMDELKLCYEEFQLAAEEVK